MTALGAGALDHAVLDRRARRWLVVLAVALVVSVVLAVGLGPVAIGPGSVARIIGHHVAGVPGQRSWPASDDAIIWQVRLPRVILGTFVGVTLGASGAALQAMVRNPLAEPYLLGVSAGASTGAALAILFGIGVGVGGSLTATTAFAGALLAMALVFSIARVGGAITPGRLLIAGVAVGYVFSAVTSLLILFADSSEGARAVMFWLLGSLAVAQWSTLPAAALTAVLCVGWLLWWRRRLDLLALGDEHAEAVGIAATRTRTVLLVVVSLCVGAAVAAAGGIGFVGLAVPHLSRRLVGAPHRRLVPAAALLGALLLVWADVLARLVLQPRELPIGVVTALVGAPALVLLVRRLHPTDL